MSTKSLSKVREMLPTVFDDFFKPWFEGDILGKTLTVPAVNITEEKDNYKVELAAPGMTKDDFSIDVEGNMLSISASQEEEKEEQDKKYTRKEYNYSSFSRSFTIPEEVNKEKIEAKYDQGVLKLWLPKSEHAKKNNGHKIAVN
jgi:HSP20 family protein